MSWESIQEKHKKHVCYPRPVPFFDRMTYQCGCGKYFNPKEDAEKQMKVWKKHEKKLMNK